ncbi:swi5-like zinc finger protein [Mactra antiquata]
MISILTSQSLEAAFGMDNSAQKKVQKKKCIPFKSPFQGKVCSKLEPENQQNKAELLKKLDKVNEEIKELQNLGYEEKELQTHIDKLHEYNEIKDVGQLVLGRIASIEGLRTKDLYERYNLALDD